MLLPRSPPQRFLLAVTRPPEGGSRYGNVNGKRNLMLPLGDTADSPVAVMLEVKGPKNPKEMLAPDNLNRKAMQQLLLYYLEDRTDEKADDFRRLIVTTGYEWYVFDALDFNRLFWKDKAFVKAFRDWKAGAKAEEGTDFFYKSIVGKWVAALTGELPVAYVDLRAGLPATPAAMAFYFLQQITTKMKDNAMAMQILQVSQIPILHAMPAEQAAIAALVTGILAAKAADTREAEAAVDAAVAALYGVALPVAR